MLPIWIGPTEGVIFKENGYICFKQLKSDKNWKTRFTPPLINDQSGVRSATIPVAC